MSQPPTRNKLLASLEPADFALLLPALEHVALDVDDTLIAPFEHIEHVHFVESGLLSVILGASPAALEVGLIGWEGLSGLSVALGGASTPFRVLVQMPGNAYRVSNARFTEICREKPAIRELVLRYAHAFAIQIAGTARANGVFNIEARLARWLLMAHDRTEGDELALTHHFLSVMLGVRRPGVTVALHVLEGKYAIRSTRGRVKIRDRRILEELAEGSYGLPEAEYDRLIIGTSPVKAHPAPLQEAG